MCNYEVMHEWQSEYLMTPLGKIRAHGKSGNSKNMSEERMKPHQKILRFRTVQHLRMSR
jgi:hypothetical protein